jgi:hypothetical protein
MSIHSDSELVHRLLEGVRLERIACEAQGVGAPVAAPDSREMGEASLRSGQNAGASSSANVSSGSSVAVQYNAVLRKAEALLLELSESTNSVHGFNCSRASSVVRGPSRKPVVEATSDVPSDLTSDQKAACLHALSREVSYIWGPAGTGKTVTLGALAAHLFGEHKRVLVVAHTHQAVDGVLRALCNRVVQGPRSQLPGGSVLKLGSFAREDLKQSFGESISFDAVTTASRLKMEKRLQDLSAELLDVEKSIWRHSHRQSLVDHERTLTIERERLLESLSTQSRGISRLFKSLPSERDPVQLTGLKADMALVEASLEEVRRSLAGTSDTPDSQGGLTELLDRQKELSGGVALLESFLRDISGHVLMRARVVGATSARAVLWLKELGQFDVVIIDEASMMPMVMSYLVSGLAKERVVVAGDFRQLPPISRHQSESARALFAQSVFESSGVAQTMIQGGQLPHVHVLTSHFRCHPEIMELFNKRFYNNRLTSTYSEGARIEDCESDSPLLKTRAVVVDTSAIAPQGLYRQGSKCNPIHAVAVGSIIQALRKADADIVPAIGVIAPFRAQVDVLQGVLRECGLNGVACGTVHRFQGDERRVMLLDLVESAPHRVGPFLSGGTSDDITTRLLNVALSRAREYLIIVANLSHLREVLSDDSLVKGLLLELEERAQVLPVEQLLVDNPLPGLPQQPTRGEESYKAFVSRPSA